MFHPATTINLLKTDDDDDDCIDDSVDYDDNGHHELNYQCDDILFPAYQLLYAFIYFTSLLFYIMNGKRNTLQCA